MDGNRRAWYPAVVVLPYLLSTAVIVAFIVGVGGVATGDDSTLASSPADAARSLCGASYEVVNAARVTAGDGAVLGEVVLLRDLDGDHCVATVRSGGSGRLSAWIDGEGAVEAGTRIERAGPVRSPASRTCLDWGGAVGDRTVLISSGSCD